MRFSSQNFRYMTNEWLAVITIARGGLVCALYIFTMGAGLKENYCE